MMLRRALVCSLIGIAQPLAWSAEKAPASAPSEPKTPTVIESGSAEMVSTQKETTFTFRDRVTVTGTNLKITCDFLEVVALRSGDPSATFGDQENFKSLVATGNVRIVQGDREALCGRAEVFPGEDKVVLTENPRVRSVDGDYEASGPMMVLHRGERRAEIVSEGGQRPRITLPPLKDLGYEKQKPKEEAKTETPSAQDPAPKIVVPKITPPNSP